MKPLHSSAKVRARIHRNRSLLSMMLVLVAISIGCQRVAFDVAPARGTVLIDGQPFAMGKVMFAPRARSGEVNAGKPAFGRLNSDGSFVLSTYGQDDGAVVGEHSVTVINTADSNAETRPANPTSRLPKFSRVSVPGMFSVVAGDENQFEIKLTSEYIAKFGSK